MMKTSLDHLPQSKQQELAWVVDVLHAEFEDALKLGTSDLKKKGRIVNIILFGSHARGDWVKEPHTVKGYVSDYDLLVIVNNQKLTDYAKLWARADDVFIRDRTRAYNESKVAKPLVNFIVHSRHEVHNALKEGQYFFSDIRRDGIVLYALDDTPLPEATPLDAKKHLEVSKQYFEERFPAATNSLVLHSTAIEKKMWKEAAFLLHQAVEHAYSALLLTTTHYDPHSHNLTFLRSQAEGQDNRLIKSWPRDQHRYAAWFNTLNEAYVKARYSPHYNITEEALTWLGERTEKLHGLVEQVCTEHLAGLKGDAKN
jgi:hypothetical protein